MSWVCSPGLYMQMKKMKNRSFEKTRSWNISDSEVFNFRGFWDFICLKRDGPYLSNANRKGSSPTEQFGRAGINWAERVFRTRTQTTPEQSSLLNVLKPTQPSLAAFSTTKSINSSINKLSSKGAHNEVIHEYASMLKLNIPPDTYTFPSLLKACTSLNMFSLGLIVHQKVVVDGFSSDAYISCSLISFYIRFGYSDIAHKVFDIMSERDVVPWTAIIGCYSSLGNIDLAFSLFNNMRQEGVPACSVTLLNMLSGVSEHIHVQCLHCCAAVHGFMSSMSLANSMLNVYRKCGCIEDSRLLFETMEYRDLISWNTMILGYAHFGNLPEVLQLVNTMKIEGIESDPQTFVSLMTAAATANDLMLGKTIHGQVLRAKLDLNSHVETSLIVMYLKTKNIEAAFRIFERCKEKDVILWTAMISGLVQNNHVEEAFDVFYEMIKARVQPSTTTMASVLAAGAQFGYLDIGTSIHGYALRHGLLWDIPVQNSLITMYAKCSHMDQSLAVFDRMNKKDLVSWNAIVAGYAQNGYLCKALFLFNEMRVNSLRPDSITIVSLLQGCSSLGALRQGKWIHSFIIRSNFRPCTLVDTALVDMYSKCGYLETANKCFFMMSCKDMISWGAVIAAQGSHGQGETALKLYSEFLQTGFKPDPVIFLAVLSSCNHSGLIDDGLQIYHSMESEFGIAPDITHNACIVDLLSRAGRVDEAYSFYKKTFKEPVVEVLGILVDACRAKGNLELGAAIGRELLVLKPGDAGNYIQLAHCYASMNNWDGVGEAWTQMRSLGLRKLPGWSYIEIHGAITTFFSDHNSHLQLEEITTTLRFLMKEMCKLRENKQIGYHDLYLS